MSCPLLLEGHQELLFDDLADDGVTSIGEKIARVLRLRCSPFDCRNSFTPKRDRMHEQDEGNVHHETARFDRRRTRTGRFHDGNSLKTFLNGGAHLTRAANKAASHVPLGWFHDDCPEAHS